MNKRKSIYAVSFVLILLGIWIVAKALLIPKFFLAPRTTQAIGDFRSENIEPSARAPVNAPAQPEIISETQVETGLIPATPTQSAVEQKSVPPLSNPPQPELELKGTVTGPAQMARAIITDKTTGKTDSYKIGDTVGGGRLVAINKDGVVIDFNGQTIELAPCLAQPVAYIPELLQAKGVSTLFLKKLELMSTDSWSGRPLKVSAAIKNLDRYDAIWCAQVLTHYNRPVWDSMQENHPEIKMYYYIAADSTRPGGEFTYYDYDYIHENHPEWFLLKNAKDPTMSDGRLTENRIRWTLDENSTSYNRFFLDFGNKDFQAWAAEQVIEGVSGAKEQLDYPYDGLALDNVHVGYWNQSLEKRCPDWKYAGNQEGCNADFFEYLRTLKQALNNRGYQLIGNHSLNCGETWENAYWGPLMDSVDGLMTEKPLRYVGSPFYTDEKWELSLSRHEEMLERDLIIWWSSIHQESTKDNIEGFMFTYCSWLLIQKPGLSYYYATRGESVYTNPVAPWYDEYNIPIGNSYGKRYRKGECWVRDYIGAKIIVNSTNQTQNIRIDNNSLWLDWASSETVSEITLPAHSGRILLPVTQK